MKRFLLASLVVFHLSQFSLSFCEQEEISMPLEGLEGIEFLDNLGDDFVQNFVEDQIHMKPPTRIQIFFRRVGTKVGMPILMGLLTVRDFFKERWQGLVIFVQQMREKRKR